MKLKDTCTCVRMKTDDISDQLFLSSFQTPEYRNINVIAWLLFLALHPLVNLTFKSVNTGTLILYKVYKALKIIVGNQSFTHGLMERSILTWCDLYITVNT